MSLDSVVSLSTLSGGVWDKDMFKFLLRYPYSRDAYENFLSKEYADENVQVRLDDVFLFFGEKHLFDLLL